MKIESKFDFKDFDSIKKYLLPKSLYVHIFCIIILLFSIFTNHVILGFIIGIIGVIAMEAFLAITKKNLTTVLKERFKQSLNGKDILEIELLFEDSTISSYCSNIESRYTITYDDILKLIIGEKYSLLFTNNNSFVVLETTKVKEKKLDEFLLSKNPKIKIR